MEKFCPWKLSLNKGNYALKSFVKNIYPAKSKKKYLICAWKLSLNQGKIKKFYKEYSALQKKKNLICA